MGLFNNLFKPNVALTELTTVLAAAKADDIDTLIRKAEQAGLDEREKAIGIRSEAKSEEAELRRVYEEGMAKVEIKFVQADVTEERGFHQIDAALALKRAHRK